MNYILGIILQIIATSTVGLANIFDDQLTRETFKSIWALVVLNGIILIPLVPVFFLILRPSGITMVEFALLSFIAAVEVFYQIPYYKALRETDTSVVVSLFSFERIFIPVFAFLVVGEKLSLLQYIGFGIIVVCSSALTFTKGSFKFSKALGYMLPTTLVLALMAALQKYGLGEMSWQTFFFWSLVLTIPFYFVILLIFPSSHPEVRQFLKNPFKKMYFVLYLQNGISFLSGGIGTAALSMIPVTVSKAIGSFQAIIVYFIASKGNKRLGLDIKERFSNGKLALLLLTTAGIILTVVNIPLH